MRRKATEEIFSGKSNTQPRLNPLSRADTGEIPVLMLQHCKSSSLNPFLLLILLKMSYMEKFVSEKNFSVLFDEVGEYFLNEIVDRD